jgi:hypothetical protein
MSVCEVKRSYAKSGETYSITAGTFHKSLSLMDITITVCETIDKLERPPFVLGAIQGKSIYIYERNRLKNDELTDIIKKI